PSSRDEHVGGRCRTSARERGAIAGVGAGAALSRRSRESSAQPGCGGSSGTKTRGQLSRDRSVEYGRAPHCGDLKRTFTTMDTMDTKVFDVPSFVPFVSFVSFVVESYFFSTMSFFI